MVTEAIISRSGGFLRARESSVSGGDASTELLPYRLRPPSTGSSLAGEHPGIFPVRRTGSPSGNCFLFRPSSRSRVPPFQEGVPRWISVACGSLVTAGNRFQASTSDTLGGPSVADLCPGSLPEELSVTTGIASSRSLRLVKVDTPSRGSPSRRIVRLRISLSRNRFRSGDTPAVEVSSVRRHLYRGISSWMGNLPSENRFPSGFPP